MTNTDLAQMSGIEQLQFLLSLPDPPPNIGQLLGMSIDRLDVGEVEFSLHARPT